ncbi:hypothetical protein FRC11_002094 [Ceratobasidium sp. 423]|nr:hypothetical protein FRC11_002094 [Ceratobasidium sp. 423]
MPVGAASPTLQSGMFSIELDAPVKSQRDASPTTLVQEMPHCGGDLRPSIAVPTVAPSVDDPILLTRKQYRMLVEAGMLGNVGGPEPPGSSLPRLPLNRPVTNAINQPKHQVSESQYTYEYHTLDHDGLVAYAQEEFGLDIQGCDTQTIIRQLQLAEAEQTAEVGPPRRSASIVVLSPTPFQVGGGWSQDVVGSQPSAPSKKRPPTTSTLSDGSSKRQRMEVVVSDTATESETDDTATESETDTIDDEVSPRAAPSPVRGATGATVPESQPSAASSHSLGGSAPSPRVTTSGEPVSQPYDFSIPPLPNITAPVRGPVHARLRLKLLQRFLDVTDRKKEAAAPAPAQAPNTNDRPGHGEQTAGVDEVPGMEHGSSFGTPQPTPGPSSAPRTYAGPRSHVPSEPEARTEQAECRRHRNRPSDIHGSPRISMG